MTKLQQLLRKATARLTGPWDELRQPRLGVMLHYTAGTDQSGVQWLLFDPKCAVSYNKLVLDDGTVVQVAPDDARAYHAGVCRSDGIVPKYEDANSAFYGVAIAAEQGDTVTPAQFEMVMYACVGYFRANNWPAEQVTLRLTDHAAQAWPRGRKVDTRGVLSLEAMQDAVRAELLKRQPVAS